MTAKGKEAEYDITGYKSAIELLDKAIERDPEFAIAWALKAHFHILITGYGPYSRSMEEADSAQRAVQKTLQFEPNLSDGYIYLGLIKQYKGEWLEAGLNFHKALELIDEPLSGDDHFIIPSYATVGKFKKAYELLEEMRQNDPTSQVIGGWYYLIYGFFGDRQRAEEEYQRRNLSIKDYSSWHDDAITDVRIRSGDVLSRDEIVSSNPIRNIGKEYLESPEDGLVELRRIYRSDDKLSIEDLGLIAIWAAYFGDMEFATEILEKSINIHGGNVVYFWFPIMREARQLPRFKEWPVSELSTPKRIKVEATFHAAFASSI